MIKTSGAGYLKKILLTFLFSTDFEVPRRLIPIPLEFAIAIIDSKLLSTSKFNIPHSRFRRRSTIFVMKALSIELVFMMWIVNST